MGREYFNWSKNGLCINIAGEWLDAKQTKIYLKNKQCCFNCWHGDFMASFFVCDIGKQQEIVGIAHCCSKFKSR